MNAVVSNFPASFFETRQILLQTFFSFKLPLVLGLLVVHVKKDIKLKPRDARESCLCLLPAFTPGCLADEVACLHRLHPVILAAVVLTSRHPYLHFHCGPHVVFVLQHFRHIDFELVLVFGGVLVFGLFSLMSFSACLTVTINVWTREINLTYSLSRFS